MNCNDLDYFTFTNIQKLHSTILNSKVSKKIHNQGETLFCWAFAISTMLRQSLNLFISNLNKSSDQGSTKYYRENIYLLAKNEEIFFCDIIPKKYLLAKRYFEISSRKLSFQIREYIFEISSRKNEKIFFGKIYRKKKYLFIFARRYFKKYILSSICDNIF